jgi:hypothetical protein
MIRKSLVIFAALAAFFVPRAEAQNAGAVSNHAIPIGKGAGVQGFGSLALTSGQIIIGQTSADPQAKTLTGDVTVNSSGVTSIGSSKVTNSQLATMAANTTKCNATAGSANPTDCTASTMRTNIGVVIGTNVEAWDADLDCVAALSSTGVISRTGAGTCSAGALALSGLATGTQDTVIGYFGSTTATATAISNCTGALTYSTSTHTFGCNASAGTGTVTSAQISAGTGIAVSGTCTITTTGNCTVAAQLSDITASLGSDVSLSSTGSFFDGPSVAQGSSGKWHASGTVTLQGAGSDTYNCKLWDGTTVISSSRVTQGTSGSAVATISLSGNISSPAGNIRISCQDVSGTTGLIRFNVSGASKDSTLTATRIQ